MKQILAAIILCVSYFATAYATPMYVGMKVDNDSTGAFLGYRLSNMYAVEAHYSRSDSDISHAGVTVNTSIVSTSIVVAIMIAMKLNDVLPYHLFAKAGYQRTTKNETYSIPSSVTLTLPYNDVITSYKNQPMLSLGAEYDVTKSVSGRMGIDFIGNEKFFNLSTIYKF